MINKRFDLSLKIFVFNTFFSSIITTNLNGGAIYVLKTNLSALIDYCSFHVCSTTLYGGAIYLNILKAKLRCLCLSFCHSDENFPSIFSTVLDTNINSFVYSSIIYSTSNSSYTVSIRNGVQDVSYINSSYNNLEKQTAGIMIYYPESSSCSSYCSLTSNKCGYSPILENSDGDCTMKNYNIIYTMMALMEI